MNARKPDCWGLVVTCSSLNHIPLGNVTPTVADASGVGDATAPDAGFSVPKTQLRAALLYISHSYRCVLGTNISTGVEAARP